MQQTLSGCAFCEAVPGTDVGKAHTWGKDKRVTHPICVDRAIQSNLDPDDRDHHACGSRGLVVDKLSTYTGPRRTRPPRSPLQLCARCSTGDPASYWTRDLGKHLVVTPVE